MNKLESIPFNFPQSCSYYVIRGVSENVLLFYRNE